MAPKEKADANASISDPATEFIERLWQSLQSNEVAVLCGAGISRSSGLPVVWDLLKAILQRLEATDEESSTILKSGLPFEAFIETLHEFSDIDPLLSIFEAGTPGSTHLFLAALAKAGRLRLICTTNFDSLIEQAMEQMGLRRERDFEVLYRDQDFSRIRQPDGKTQVVKVHGSIDDKAGMAITLKQVASKMLTESRREVIDTVFSGGTHSRVLILGYSCSDAFDLSPQIESISAGHRQVVLIDHFDSGWKICSLAEREKKNPFRNFPDGQWVLCNTDELLTSLKERGGLKIPAAKPAPAAKWEVKVNEWFKGANEKNKGLAGPACLGALFHKISDFKKSLAHYSRALDGARAAGDRQREGIYLGNVGNSEEHLGRMSDALRSFMGALGIARELGDRPREGMWLSNLGGLCIRMRDLDRGIDYLERAIEICREIKDVKGECYAMANLGSASHLGGDDDRAMVYYAYALKLALDLGDKEAELSMRDNLGQIAYSVGQYAKAVEHHQAAIITALDLGDRSAECNLEAQLGKSYTATGDYEKATLHLDRAINLAQTIGDRFQEANRVNELGLVYHARKDFQKAAEFHRRALDLARSVGHPALEAMIAGNLGNVCFDEERYQDAIPLYQQALTMATQTKDIGLQAKWLCNLGSCRLQLNEFEQAIELLEKALERASGIEDRLQVGHCEFNLGSVHFTRTAFEEGCLHYSRAVDAYRSILGNNHELTQKALERRDLVAQLLPPIFCVERPDGGTFTLLMANGKVVVLVFTSGESAIRFHDLLLEKRFEGPFRVLQMQIPREAFESNVLTGVARPEDFLFAYEDDEDFGRWIEGLEKYQPPS